MQANVDSPEYENYDFIIKTGATEPPIQAQLTDDSGTAVDLTGSSVEFRMKAASADSLKVDSSATITDATNGQVEYAWVESDTDVEDVFNAEFAVDYDGQTGSSFDADEFFPNDSYLGVYVMPSL